ncbi:hypothetical protein PR202_gb28640 [Eleusine coracana subsp. coracana]|uniref:BED-type domain-containing protein n=1 Tax=Eleusine coracana subsp. coracana TaxID=191504 RepID=A0AAV5FXH6_ELECO|nr:hypothetical protein PR202_gb28640 [Eleusine coracana subsp. coracana]
MQTQGCLQLAEEADKEHKKMVDKIAERCEVVKTSYKKFVAEVQASTSRVMDHMDEHEGYDIKTEVASDGSDGLSRFRSKKRSKVWDEYKPIFVNGVIQSAECHYCHILMSCKGADGQSNGTSHLWRHQKICRGKDGLGLGQQQQIGDLPYVLNDVEPVDQILPDSLDDFNLGADCVHCNKRLSADKGRSHLTRHTLTCSARGGTTLSHQKCVFQSRVPNLKSRLQDELSPALTNGRVQIAEYASKFRKGNNSDWKLQRRIIKFGVFWSSPTNLERMVHYKDTCLLDAESGAYNVIWEAVRDWNLDQKHFSLTSVSEVRNEGSIPKLMDSLNQQKCLPIRGGLYNIACVDDVLNNIVSKGQPVLHLDFSADYMYSENYVLPFFFCLDRNSLMKAIGSHRKLFPG